MLEPMKHTLAASDWGGLLGTLFFVALLVGLKLLEVIFRKITEARHRERLGQDDVRIVEEDVRPTAGGPYLPYEETAEEIFGDYINLRRRVAGAKRRPAPPPAPRPHPAPSHPAPSHPAPSRPAPSRPAPSRPAPIPVTEVIEDIVVLDRPVLAPPRRRAAMSVAEARRAFIASLIFGPPRAR